MQLLRLNGQIPKYDILISYPDEMAQNKARELIKAGILHAHQHAQALFAIPRYDKAGFSTVGDYERVVLEELLAHLKLHGLKKFDMHSVPSVGSWNNRPSDTA